METAGQVIIFIVLIVLVLSISAFLFATALYIWKE